MSGVIHQNTCAGNATTRYRLSIWKESSTTSSRYSSPLLRRSPPTWHKANEALATKQQLLATQERAIQKLRAFVRPVHGEILVLKGDSHPTHKSKHIDDYCDDSGIQKKFSPPYVHEGVGEAEITFQWDVPTANCLLLQSDSHERYFESAFYDVERSGNRLCKYDGKSRDIIYYGHTNVAPLTCHMIYVVHQ